MRANIKRIKFVYRKDRLSDLHDDILIQILSFLDTKSAAQTCVFSRRWNNKLWIHHPDVFLNGKTFSTSYKFRSFVDMVLAQRDKLCLQSRSFSFTWTLDSMIPQQLLDKVHDHAQNVRHFDISICCCASNCSYPSQNFEPKSLTTLRLNLSIWNRESPCTDVNLKVLRLYLSGCTALKTLWLEKLQIEICSDDIDLFSSLVDVRELHIIGCHIIEKDRRFLIRAPRLERLTILQNNSESDMSAPNWEISLCKLQYLRTDLWLSWFTIDHLPRYVEELEIEFLSYKDYRTAGHAKWLINRIVCLPCSKSVTLSKSTLQVISAFPEIFESRVPVTLPQFKCEVLKVITKNELPVKEFPENREGLAGLMKNCSKTLKVEFV